MRSFLVVYFVGVVFWAFMFIYTYIVGNGEDPIDEVRRSMDSRQFTTLFFIFFWPIALVVVFIYKVFNLESRF